MQRTILLIILTFTLTACTLNRDKEARVLFNPDQAEPSEIQSEGGPVAEESDSYHEVSLNTLINQEIIGSDFTIGQVLAENESYTRYYITYKSGDLNISGIMNVPKGQGPFPLLVLNHGHIDPAIYTNGRGLKREQDYLARRGYVVVHPDYRGHAESDDIEDKEDWLRLGYTQDVIAVVKAIQAAQLEFVDASRVGMLGHSMGGGITLNALVVAPGLIDAAVLFAPVSADARRNFNKWIVRRPERAEQIIAAYGSPTTSPEFWDGISAYNYFDRVTAPIMNHHGSADDSVPLAWSDELEVWLNKAGIVNTYYVYPGEPHEFAVAWPQVMQRTVDFFNEHL